MTDADLKKQFKKLDESLTEKIDDSMLIIAKEFERVHRKIDNFSGELKDFRGEANTHFDSLERRLDSHATQLNNHETRIAHIEKKPSPALKTS